MACSTTRGICGKRKQEEGMEWCQRRRRQTKTFPHPLQITPHSSTSSPPNASISLTSSPSQVYLPFQLFGSTSSQETESLGLLALFVYIGVARCGTFTRRLYNFTGKGDADPSLDAAYAANLRQKCPNPPVDRTTTVEMDPLDSESFNNHYYAALTRHQGIFQSEAALLTDPAARWAVEGMKNNRVFFFRQFAASMLKMAAIDVLTGDDGEIRKNCHFVN